ncbi:MAG: hypothetical protein OEY11_10475 [Gammaproteobacteria bacterium]|nr:hypothetical protein [Gammaproteobacteria bacterium]
MNNLPTNKVKRHNHYINTGLQNRLIVSLILIELVLIAISVLFVYRDMHQIIEASMFRSHIQNSLTIEYFAGRVMQVMFVLLLINIVIASFVVWRWREYVNAILSPLEKIVSSVHALDFTKKEEITAHHQAVVIAGQWLQAENSRFSEIRRCIASLNSDDSAALSDEINRCRQLIEKT